jgi:hypothetical protein
VVVELTPPSSPAPQVAVNTTRIAAPPATSVAELTLIVGALVAVAGAPEEAVAATRYDTKPAPNQRARGKRNSRRTLRANEAKSDEEIAWIT